MLQQPLPAYPMAKRAKARGFSGLLDHIGQKMIDWHNLPIAG